MTGRELITSSLRLIGAIAPGESLQAGEASDGLVTLNALIDSLSNENLLIYEQKKEASITLTPGTSSYLLGSGGSITTRPMRVDFATIQVGTQEYAMKPLTEVEYARIGNKSLQSNIPEMFWDNGAYPARTLYLYPTPSAANTLNLYTLRALSQISTLDTTVDFPPGYLRMLRFNLAIDLAPEYGRQVTPEIASAAMESKALIKRTNTEIEILRCDGAVAAHRGFNFVSGGNFN